LSAPVKSSLFPAARRSFLSTVPRTLASSCSSSCELYFPYRVRSELSPAQRERFAPPLGFDSPSRHQSLESTQALEFPVPATFRPQRFSRSRRFPPPGTSWAYFIPLPRPGFALQGVSSLPSRRASSARRALLSLVSFSSRQVAPPLPDSLTSSSGL